MRWASALSENRSTEDAIAEAAEVVTAELIGAPADIVLVFVSPHHAAAYASIPSWLADRFPRARIAGCSAGGVIGGGREVEARPAVSLVAAAVPGVEARPLRFAPGDKPPPDGAHFLILADPFTCDADDLIERLDARYPEARKVGGLASGGGSPGSNVLFLDGEAHDDGAVGLALALLAAAVAALACTSAATSACERSCRKAAGRSGSRWRSPAASATPCWSSTAARRRRCCGSCSRPCPPRTRSCSAPRSTSGSR